MSNPHESAARLKKAGALLVTLLHVVVAFVAVIGFFACVLAGLKGKS